jgi:hypothetical protein
MTDSTFPVKTVLLAAAAAPVSYAVTLVKKTVPGMVALIIGYVCVGVWALSAGAIAEGEPPNGLVLVLAGLISMILFVYGYTLIAVTLHRIFLLGASDIPGNGIRSWSARETRFFGWGTAVGLMAGLLGAVLIGISVLGVDIDPAALAAGETSAALTLRMFIALLPVAYLLGRLAFVLPATATGSRPSLGWSWGFSRKYHLQTALVVGVVPIAASSLMELVAGVLPTLLAAPLFIVVNVYLGVFSIAALSFSYRFLRDVQPDLLAPSADAEQP